MKVLTAAQMREVDRLTTERYGVSSLQLMENAGRGVAACVQRFCGAVDRQRILVLCGRGNNGGDGLVAARELLMLGARPDVLVFAGPGELRGDAGVNLQRWLQLAPVTWVADHNQWEQHRQRLAKADVVVDALLGTGLRGAAEGLLAAVIEDLNRMARRARVVAVDIPSGMSSDTCDSAGPVVVAHLTVTFTAPKMGQIQPPNAEQTGQLIVWPIGTPPGLVEEMPSTVRWSEPGEFQHLPLRRQPNTHKGTYGHVLAVAGSVGKSGAAGLVGLGALRAGAGLVTVACPETVQPLVATVAPELMTEPLPATEAGTLAGPAAVLPRLSRLCEGKNVLTIGPGLGQQRETQQTIEKCVLELPLPIVLDADGLNAVAGRAGEVFAQRSAPLAITPHPGEMARLLGCSTADIQARRLELAREMAQKWQSCVVLKGFRTVIAAPDGQVFVNSTGNPGMATAGTGDVLTGILAGLTAQFGTHDWARILALGVYLHGLAGDLAARERGEMSMIATDLCAKLPEAWKTLLAELEPSC
jgi:NAD(P)H-hydrate epimerase